MRRADNFSNSSLTPDVRNRSDSILYQKIAVNMAISAAFAGGAGGVVAIMNGLGSAAVLFGCTLALGAVAVSAKIKENKALSRLENIHMLPMQERMSNLIAKYKEHRIYKDISYACSTINLLYGAAAFISGKTSAAILDLVFSGIFLYVGNHFKKLETEVKNGLKSQ